MKLLIVAGFAILFISTFFVFFIIGTLSSGYVSCTSAPTGVLCNFADTGVSFVLRLLVMGVFIVLDIYVVNIIFGELTSVGRLRKRYREIAEMKRISENDYYKKDIDETTFKKLMLNYERELNEVRVKLKESERGLPAGEEQAEES